MSAIFTFQRSKLLFGRYSGSGSRFILVQFFLQSEKKLSGLRGLIRMLIVAIDVMRLARLQVKADDTQMYSQSQCLFQDSIAPDLCHKKLRFATDTTDMDMSFDAAIRIEYAGKWRGDGKNPSKREC